MKKEALASPIIFRSCLKELITKYKHLYNRSLNHNKEEAFVFFKVMNAKIDAIN
jgi:hypothetical protein